MIYACEQNLGKLERTLNYAAYIPLAGAIPGALRAMIGVVQIVAGSIIGGICYLVSCRSRLVNDRTRWNFRAQTAFEQVKHGWANLLRGIIEIIPCGGLTLAYNYDRFGHRVTYCGERRLAS